MKVNKRTIISVCAGGAAISAVLLANGCYSNPVEVAVDEKKIETTTKEEEKKEPVEEIVEEEKEEIEEEVVEEIDYIAEVEEPIYYYDSTPVETYIPVENYVAPVESYTAPIENTTDQLTAAGGVYYGPSGKETYYNLPMDGVVSIMRDQGNTDEYWVRDDGVKMLGDYIMVGANLDVHPRGSLVETSLGTGIVCDTGGAALADPTLIDVATSW